MKLLLICLMFLLPVSVALGQGSDAAIPAVWAWEVKSQGRTVYLMGELHRFHTTNNGSVDYRLAEKIHSVSEQTFTESDEPPVAATPARQKNSHRLGARTWAQIGVNIEAAIASIPKRISRDKNLTVGAAMEELDNLNAARFIRTLQAWAELQHFVQTSKKPGRRPIGASDYIAILERHVPQKKLKPLEPPGTTEAVWLENCDTDANLLAIVTWSLTMFDSAGFANATAALPKIQTLFKEQRVDIEALHGVISSSIDMATETACNLIPRNLLWLPTMKAALDGKGPPVAFLVGIAHVGGEQGLLSLLKQQGYTDIKRVYAID